MIYEQDFKHFDALIKLIAFCFNVTPVQITGQRRDRNICFARHLLVWYATQRLQMKHRDVARLLRTVDSKCNYSIDLIRLKLNSPPSFEKVKIMGFITLADDYFGIKKFN